jgi:hypothetical protein
MHGKDYLKLLYPFALSFCAISVRVANVEKAVDVGTPIVKELTQEARDYVNSPEQLKTT